jgi:hypothetical protein
VDDVTAVHRLERVEQPAKLLYSPSKRSPRVRPGANVGDHLLEGASAGYELEDDAESRGVWFGEVTAQPHDGRLHSALVR